MKHLSEIILRTICKILTQQNGEEKKFNKYKMIDRNVKKYYEIARAKIKGKKRIEKFNEIKKMIKMFDVIKRMKVNIEDEH